MKYLVTLDALSVIGKIYANGDNDGFVSDGKINHPVLECTQIVTDSPYYISATRTLCSESESDQILYLPHGSVVSVHCFELADCLPFGLNQS